MGIIIRAKSGYIITVIGFQKFQVKIDYLPVQAPMVTSTRIYLTLAIILIILLTDHQRNLLMRLLLSMTILYFYFLTLSCKRGSHISNDLVLTMITLAWFFFIFIPLIFRIASFWIFYCVFVPSDFFTENALLLTYFQLLCP